MKKTDKAVLTEGLRKLSALAAEIADQLDGVADTPAKKAEEPAPAPAPTVATVTREDVRAILADKSRTGFRAEVKALLTEFGAEKLSDITDPDTLAALAKKAEVIGNA